MPRLTKKHYKKRSAKQKKSKGGRRTKRVYKKMKGGVPVNPVFRADSLPSNTYYELNKYEPDLQRTPELVDARLLPTMKGGRKTRKSRTHKKHGGTTTYMDYVKAPYRAIHKFTRGKKSVGHLERIEQKKCDKFVIDMSENWIALDGEKLWRYYDSIKNNEEVLNKSLFKNIDFYKHKDGCELTKLGKLKSPILLGSRSDPVPAAYGQTAGFLFYYYIKFPDFSNRNVTAWQKWTYKDVGDYHQFYIKKTDFDDIVKAYEKNLDEFKLNLETLTDKDLDEIFEEYKTNTDKYQINPEYFKVDPKDDQFGKDYDTTIKRFTGIKNLLPNRH